MCSWYVHCFLNPGCSYLWLQCYSLHFSEEELKLRGDLTKSHREGQPHLGPCDSEASGPFSRLCCLSVWKKLHVSESVNWSDSLAWLLSDFSAGILMQSFLTEKGARQATRQGRGLMRSIYFQRREGWGHLMQDLTSYLNLSPRA